LAVKGIKGIHALASHKKKRELAPDDEVDVLERELDGYLEERDFEDIEDSLD
jgi:hypothetical protein